MRMIFATAFYDYCDFSYESQGFIEESEWYPNSRFGVYPLVVISLENDEHFVWMDKVL